MDMHSRILINIGVDGCFGGFDYRLAEGIVIFVENDGEVHFHTRDAQVIF